MKGQKSLPFLMIPALLAAGYLWVSASAKAADKAAASPEVTQLLSSTEKEALELRDDAMKMQSFTRSQLGRESHAQQITLIKEHVNKAGELLAQMHANREAAAPWQQQAIDEITPLLRQLADNTTAAIEHLNSNPTRLSQPGYKEYLAANSAAAERLATLVGDYVEYGQAHEKLDLLSEKLDTTQN